LVRYRDVADPIVVKSAIATPDGFAPADVVNGEPVASANVASRYLEKR